MAASRILYTRCGSRPTLRKARYSGSAGPEASGRLCACAGAQKNAARVAKSANREYEMRRSAIEESATDLKTYAIQSKPRRPAFPTVGDNTSSLCPRRECSKLPAVSRVRNKDGGRDDSSGAAIVLDGGSMRHTTSPRRVTKVVQHRRISIG